MEIVEAVHVVVVEQDANALPQITEPFTGVNAGAWVALTVTVIVPFPQWPQLTAVPVARGGKVIEHVAVFVA